MALVYLLTEQIIISGYHTVIYELIVGLTLAISVLILITLAFSCLRSYFSTRNNMVGVYAIAIIALSVHLTSALIYVEMHLYNKPGFVTSIRDPWASYYSTALQNKLFTIYERTNTMSFVAMWIASILLTKQYSNKIGRLKYWIIVNVPLPILLIPIFSSSFTTKWNYKYTFDGK